MRLIACATILTASRFLLGMATPAAAGEAPTAETVARGKALFERIWKPNDPRSRGGDGLGPVFNAQSCLACHDQGGVGGAGGVERNIEVITAGPAAGFDSFVFGGAGYQFAYGFGMDFGNGRFEYRLASKVPGSSNPRTNRPNEPKLDPAALARAHPGLARARSVILHRFGTDPDYHAWRAGVVGSHGPVVVKSGLLNPSPLFGLGLVDAIPEEVIAAGAKRKAGRVPGRVSRLADGRIGRFGWKARTATLAEFVAAAAAGEIGLELPDTPQAADPRLPGLGAPGLDLNAEDVDELVAFVQSLPAPVLASAEDPKIVEDRRVGEATFKTIGCAGCHVPDLGEVKGLYSDLLLHEMDARSADSGPYGVLVARDAPRQAGETRGFAPPSAREWRTPPLWGLRDSSPYLHDGRAATIHEAIREHGGQGAESARRYARLSGRRREQLVAFLEALIAPLP